MEQERITLIVIISTLVIVVFAIAIVVLFAVFQKIKYKLLKNNKLLHDIIRKKLPTLHLD